MKLTFIGNPNEPADNRGFVEMHGVRFPLNVAVEVEPSDFFRRMARNNHFRAEDGTAAEAPAPVEPTPVPSEQPADFDPLEGMDREALLAFAAERDIPLDRRLKDPAKIASVIRQSLE